ncbi:MAG TPA: SMC-Scp complex subunit ScpB [Actinophytocola sp.]|uniref:SMC-Scp complex subunit ScpB n=1 Tax=Actinophytocola sp. TaxID=1872138 RepID=UPI002DDCBDF3|nr:SMC-Scp complex subunit ScpB [Actinophytocola sp.]HEV2780024.1 SMC-Scp complex subunit ScpB [Actinophytocola sp.]
MTAPEETIVVPDEEISAEEVAPDGGPVGDAAVEEVAAEDAPADGVAAGDAPADDAPAGDAAVEEVAAEDASADGVAVGDAAVEEVATEEVPVAMADSDLPDLSADGDLEAALEALLLVVDSPAEEELLATAVGAAVTRVNEALLRMAARYTEQGRGIDLRHVGGGWRFYTRDRFAPFVEKLLLDGQRSRLTRAALETLAVIAYRQPVTRQRVAAVRGVNVDGVIRTLLARGLIEETGTDSETGGILYRTTELFLERIGLSSLDELPPIAPLLPEVDAIDDV